MNVFGWGILVISFFRCRWFCRFLCPVGLGCDLISKKGTRKGKKRVQKIPGIGTWLAIVSLGAALTGIPLFILLDPLAIFNGFFAAFSEVHSLAVYFSLSALPVLLLIHLFLPGIWCSKICPIGGLFDILTQLGKLLNRVRDRQVSKSDRAFGRRMFIASGAGLMAGIFLPKGTSAENKIMFRPPASLPDNLFNTLCVRCGNCIKACPTKIILHHRGNNNLAAWMTPEISFHKNGYCLDDCNLCGTVCPSGSISPFSVEAKKNLFIGSIRINLEKCLLTELKECDRCKAVCFYQAIGIEPSGESVVMHVVADVEKCVGCGACAAVCPPETIQMIPKQTL